MPPPDPKRPPTRYEVPMLLHALSVLEAMADSAEPLRLQDLAAVTGASKSSVFRILATFEQQGYVERAGDGSRFRLGRRLVDLASAVEVVRGVEAVARPFLEALHDRFGETVNLGALRGRQLVYSDVLESDQAFRIAAHVGATAPLHASALGKAILATHPDEGVTTLLGEGPFAAYTARTLTELARVKGAVSAARRRGYASDDEEIERGASCIAAAIPGRAGPATHAISLSGPTVRIAERREEIVAALREACDAIAARLDTPPKRLRQHRTPTRPGR